MSLFIQENGKRSTYDKILSTTGEVTVYEITKQNVKATIESIWVSSNTAGSALTLLVKDGSTTLYPIVIAQDVDQDTVQPLVNDYHRTLRYPQKITAQAAVANQLAVSVILIEGGGN